MFIELGSYIFSSEEIRYVAKYPSGCNVYLKNTKEAVYVTGINDEEYLEFTKKLCGEDKLDPCDCLTYVSKEEEELMSMKLCDRKTCYGCDFLDLITNPVDNTEPQIHVCKMQRKEILDNLAPTPYNFFKSEYLYKEEK